jgi:GT2 family glycosyltransferase
MEVIIWDNGSTDGTPDEIDGVFNEMKKEGWERLNLIRSEENLGAFTSRDELLKRIDPKTNYVLSIDDDVFLPPDSLSSLLARLQDYPDARIIGPRTVYENNPNKTAHGAGFVNLWSGKYSDIDSDRLTECDYIIGCCMLIEKEVISALKGFDRDYYTSHGEVDFCLKAKNLGYKILYEPEVIVRHNVDIGGTRTHERLYYLYRNKLLVLRKNGRFLQVILSLSIHVSISSIINILRSLFKRSDVSEAKIVFWALFDGIRNRVGKTSRKFK